MKKTFVLEGLHCPNCSAKIEKEVGALEGVALSNVNLVNQTLTVEGDLNCLQTLSEKVVKIVHSHEPDVVVSETGAETTHVHCEEHEHSHSHSHGGDSKSEIIKLTVGAVIYVVGLIMSHFMNLPIYAELGVLIVAYVVLGGSVVVQAVKNILKGRIFDENFLMTVSTVGAFVIGSYPEAVAVMLFYQIGEFFQDLAVKRSRRSISDLMDIRPDAANLMIDGKMQIVPPEKVSVGDIIVVKPGEKIPLDGIVIEGESMVDTVALTGESVPRFVRSGDNALSGCINQSGVLTVKVTKLFHESTACRIINLVENAASRKAPTENFITTFSRYYTPIVVILAALLAVVPPLLLSGGWTDWIRRGFVFLVISCPCALVISIPLTFFGGIGSASRKGVLVKGSNYLEALNKLDTVVFDKTGTLTEGVFKVREVIPADGFSNNEVLEFAAKAESFSNHPIARSIQSAYGKSVDGSKLSEYTEIAGHGISVIENSRKVIVGNSKAMEEAGIRFNLCDKLGTKVYVAVDGRFAGCIIIADEVKPDSYETISNLKALGIQKTVMLTGDDKQIAESVAGTLELDEYYAELLPDQKVDKLEQLCKNKKSGKKIAFVGDGINDAPVLARADIGIAMGGLGSDAAIEAADVVLMTDEPSKLIDAVKTAKATKSIVMQNIIFALGVKLIFLILGAFGIAGMWEAVFGDVGVMLIAVLNSMRILKK